MAGITEIRFASAAPTSSGARRPPQPEPRDSAGVSGGKEARAGGKVLPVEAERAPTRREVERAVERLVELARNNRRGLRFYVDEGSGRTVITVYNAATDEVIRQIPSEEIIAIARAVRAQRGDLLSERA